MGIPVLRGTKNPLLQEWKVRYSPSRGSLASYSYRGLDIGLMSAQALALANDGFELEMGYKWGVATLTANGSADGLAGIGGISNPANSIIDKWEIGVDEEKPTLFENQNYMHLFASADATYAVSVSHQVAQVIKQAAESPIPTWGGFVDALKAAILISGLGTPATTGGGATIPLFDVVNAFSLLSSIKYFYDDYSRGATNFIHSKYRVRHTTISPSNYARNVADFNVEHIYTIAQLLSELQSTSLWILPLPTYLAYKILNYPVPLTVPPNYLFGALKLRGDAVTTSRSRVEIKTEYLIDTWPRHTYGSV